jgi:hypothetical protein
MFGFEILSLSMFPRGYLLWAHGIKIAQEDGLKLPVESGIVTL